MQFELWFQFILVDVLFYQDYGLIGTFFVGVIYQHRFFP
jgi:hypothetical protein